MGSLVGVVEVVAYKEGAVLGDILDRDGPCGDDASSALHN